MRVRASDKVIIAGGIWVLVLTLAIKAFSSYFGYFGGLNTEDCIKGRYFFIEKNYKTLKDGDYFVFRFKGSKLYRKGTLFVKIVGCSAGEHLYTKKTSKGLAYYCNDRLLGYACDRKKYKNCPAHLEYNEIIPKGYYYAMGTAYNAYDSRYYGLVNEKAIVGKAIKLF